MSDRRTPHETKEIGVKRLIDNYKKNNRSECPSEQVRVFEKLYEKELLPHTYEKDKKK